MNRFTLTLAAPTCVALATIAACSSQPPEAYGGSAGVASTQRAQATEPMLVVVDTDRTVNAPAGEGAGVFVEYEAGGHWLLSWTCDTAASNQSCQFYVNVSGATIANVATTGFASTDSIDTSNGKIVAQTTTTLGTVTVTFDTLPDTRIRVFQSISGNADGSYFGFVQNGAPNGNDRGPLSDPLEFVGSTP